MSTSNSRPYHHGNLKAELLNASRKLIAENGIRGFTLRAAARAASVSSAAPYRHFPEKEHLLAELARQGFDRLRDALSSAAEGADQGHPFNRIMAQGCAYYRFALENPADIAVMFECRLDNEQFPEVRAASEGAFGALFGECIRLLGGKVSEQSVLDFAQTLWALVHGLALLSPALQQMSPQEPMLIAQRFLPAFFKGFMDLADTVPSMRAALCGLGDGMPAYPIADE